MKKKAIKIKPFSLFLMFIFFFILTIFMPLNFAKADDIVYSDVLTDLQVDSSFSVEDYPVVENDYSLQVIQIAESVNNELFVYVYQPSANEVLQASSINISTEIDENLHYTNYKLTLLNSFGVFQKYLVENFTVEDISVRYYDISSVYRPWDEDFDKSSEEENTVNEISYNVSKRYIFEDTEEDTNIICIAVETVTVTDKYVGFVRYNGGYTWDALTYESCDNHFVAFSTDYAIDSLIEAELYYTSRTYEFYHKQSMTALTKPSVTYGDIEENYVKLEADDKEEYQGNIFHKKYTWNKISTVENFIVNESHDNVFHVGVLDVRTVTKLSEEGLDEIQDKQWVLRFATTNYMYKEVGYEGITDVITEINSTEVMNVSILRLKFETEGSVYNLGVIDNKQTGDGIPDNETDTTVDNAPWFQAIVDFFNSMFVGFGKVVMIIVAIVLGIIILPFLPRIIVFIGKVVWWILKAIWWVITLPLELFKK